MNTSSLTSNMIGNSPSNVTNTNSKIIKIYSPNQTETWESSLSYINMQNQSEDIALYQVIKCQYLHVAMVSVASMTNDMQSRYLQDVLGSLEQTGDVTNN